MGCDSKHQSQSGGTQHCCINLPGQTSTGALFVVSLSLSTDSVSIGELLQSLSSSIEVAT